MPQLERYRAMGVAFPQRHMRLLLDAMLKVNADTVDIDDTVYQPNRVRLIDFSLNPYDGTWAGVIKFEVQIDADMVCGLKVYDRVDMNETLMILAGKQKD